MIKRSLITFFKGYTLSQHVMRLLLALLIPLLVSNLISSHFFTSKDYYSDVNFSVFICSVALLYFIFFFIKNQRIIGISLLSFALAYLCLTANHAQSYLFSFGACLCICMIVIYFGTFPVYFTPGKRTTLIIITLLILAFTVSTGIVCCLKYFNHATPCFDFGIFSQMFYNMKESGLCVTTCERDQLLSHFAVHFSPIYYLLLPIYYLFPSPVTLLIAQGAIISSGVIPLYFLGRHFKLSNGATIVFSIIYLLYPAFLGGNFWYLHENSFLAPLLLWLLYFSEKEKTLPALISAMLTLTVKEEAPLYVAVCALYFIFTRKNYKCNLFLFVLSVIYFTAVTQLMGIFGEGIMSDSRYGDYIYDGGGIFTVVKAVVQNPVYAIYQIFTAEKLIFALQMLAPLCFLPVVIKKPSRLILLIPFILVNLMTSYPYQFDIGFQYAFGSGAIFFYLALSTYSELSHRHNSKALLCALLSSIIIFSGGYMSTFNYLGFYCSDAERRESVNYAFSLIPEDASVICSTFFLPNLSQREFIYELESSSKGAEYVAVDLRYPENESYVEKYLFEGYSLIYYSENAVALLAESADREQ